MKTSAFSVKVAWFALAGMVVGSLSAQAQTPRHYQYHSQLPPGEVGARELNRRPVLHGFFQPVLIQGPETSVVAIGEEGAFGIDDLGRKLVGLQVGRVYRLRIGQIPQHEDQYVYPSIEVIDRLHPPAGKESRYPIPVDITREELLMALSGKYVTRVIYVEDPRQALPVRDLPEQRYLESLPQEDPLQLAGTLGRPVAILRIGSYVPEVGDASDTHFLFDSPPVLRMAAPMAVQYSPSELQPETPTELPPKKLEFQPTAPRLPEAMQQPRVEPRKPVAPRTEQQPGLLDDDVFGETNDEGLTPSTDAALEPIAPSNAAEPGADIDIDFDDPFESLR